MENQKIGYLKAVDGLRGMAVLAVIIFHIDAIKILGGGFTGVDIFFVISGYVISRSLYSRQEAKTIGFLTEFYKRRILRILPALMLCLLVTVVLTVLFIPEAWLSRTIDKTGSAAFFGYSNFTLVWNNDGYFSPRVELNPFLHTWSLAVEEQFYLIFPLLFLIRQRFKDRRSLCGFVARVLLPLAGVLSLLFVIRETGPRHAHAFYLLPGRFWELAGGALLFQCHADGKLKVRSRRVSSLFMLAGILLVMGGFIFANQRDFPFPWALVPVTGTLLLITSIVSTGDQPLPLQRFLGSGIPVYTGKISYALYLWHWPLVVLLRWTVGMNSCLVVLLYLGTVFLLAVLSFHFIENPLRGSPFLLNKKNYVIILGGLVCVCVLFGFSRVLFHAKDQLSLSVTRDSYQWRSRRYSQDRMAEPVAPAAEIGRHKLFIAGDSHTSAYRTMLNIVSARLGIETAEYEAGGCAVAGLLKPLDDPACRAHYERSLGEIKGEAEPEDILFLASLRMPELANMFEPEDIDLVVEKYFSEEAVKDRELALREADRLVAEFEALGVIVLIEAPLPVLKAPPFRCSDWFNKMNPVCEHGLTVSRRFLEELRQPVMDSIGILRERHGNVSVWDPFPVLCREEVFSAYSENGEPVFFDGDHLSANGNRMLVDSFIGKLKELW